MTVEFIGDDTKYVITCPLQLARVLAEADSYGAYSVQKSRPSDPDYIVNFKESIFN
jgi:hypothetical protein